MGGMLDSGVSGARTTWLPMTDDQASLAIGSIAVADCTSGGCDSVYAGTGENAIRRDTYYGRGLLVGRRAGPGGGAMGWTLRKFSVSGSSTNFRWVANSIESVTSRIEGRGG